MPPSLAVDRAVRTVHAVPARPAALLRPMFALALTLARIVGDHLRQHAAPSHVCLFNPDCWQARRQFGAPLRVHWHSGRFITVVPGRPLPAGTPVTVATPPAWVVARRFVDVCVDLERFTVDRHVDGQVTVRAACGCGADEDVTARSLHAAIRCCIGGFATQRHRPIAWAGTPQARDRRAQAATGP